MKTVIVDDSEIDRFNLVTLLSDHPEVSVVGEAVNLSDAVALIEMQKPDVIFLDVHLGKDKGFEVLEKLKVIPQVIITTAHPHYALKGFDIDAVDYILKPVMEDSLARALARVDFDGDERTDLGKKLDEKDVLIFRRADGFDVVTVSDIHVITGDRIYTKIGVANGMQYLHNRRLREWRDLLPENIFKTLDRSTIVNVREISRIVDIGTSGYRLHFTQDANRIELGSAGMKVLRDHM